MTAPVYRWQPSTAEIAARAGIAVEDVIRFDHNTSPAAPPWAAPAAADASDRLNEYPAADYSPLREAVAAHHGVDPDQVVPGAGADELILLAAKAFLEPGDRAVADVPAYPLYRIATLQHGGDFVGVARGDDLAFPTSALADAAACSAVTWLCVPHNPVGDRPSDQDLDRVRNAASGVVVVDAAYAEFTGDRWSDRIADDPDLVVLGTLSKAFGLAGIRVGYALTSPRHAAALHAVRPPGSISTVSAAIAVRALQDPSWMYANVAVLRAARADLADRLTRIGLDVRPSTTNFLLAPVPDASDVATRLMDRGIVVRAYAADHPLADHLRFTVRSPGEHDRLVAELEEALG
ncbi:MAG: aminotransferase class I/II-fold pyridoxal phosphate-dependent enzyme [Acidimicrobiia bacterium]|nr:aminotransferase class I/II-fold pyridoxal phosphate-dependent enzyme [Acidimicrobiia bacterium]